jgi:hypothetical protein
MKRKIYVFAALLTIALVGLFIRRPEKQGTDAPKHKQHDSPEQSSRISIVEADNAESNGTGREKMPLPGRRVYKPTSLQVGQGGATVIEIDHGLRLVDRFKGERYSDDVENGKRKGAMGAITLRVVDTTGVPVEGAELFGGFWTNNPDDTPVTGISDENGNISVEHLCTGDFNFSITKNGYYRTTLRYWFFKTGFDCAKDGRWLPWNPTVEVTLKEKRNPISMAGVNRLLFAFPIRQKAGFDFEIGDLVEPFGNGKTPDISFWYDSWQDITPYCYSNRFVVAVEDGGAIATMRKDSFSDFKFAYAPPDSGWVSGLALGMVRTEDKILSNVALAKEEYWVIAVRRGEIKRFAVVSDFEFGGSERGTNFCGVLLSYYLNPNAGDTNLEIKGHYP